MTNFFIHDKSGSWYPVVKLIFFACSGIIVLLSLIAVVKTQTRVDMNRSTLHCLGPDRYFTMQAFSNSYEPGDNQLSGSDRSLALATCDAVGAEAGLTPIPTLYSRLNDGKIYDVNFVSASSFSPILLLPLVLLGILELSRRIFLRAVLGRPLFRAKDINKEATSVTE